MTARAAVRRRLWRARRRDERGSITPFVLIVAVGILALGGWVIDGGRQLNAHGRAIAYAEEASRAGAQEINVYDKTLDLDSPLAVQAAANYCAQAMANDAQLTRCEPKAVSIKGDDDTTFTGIQVDTSVDIKTILLGLFGTPDLHASGRALARPVTGITGPNSARLDQLPPPAVATPGGPTAPVETAPPTNPGDLVTPCTTDKPTPTEGPTKNPSDKPTKKPTTKPTRKPSKNAAANGAARIAADPSPTQCVTNEP